MTIRTTARSENRAWRAALTIAQQVSRATSRRHRVFKHPSYGWVWAGIEIGPCGGCRDLGPHHYGPGCDFSELRHRGKPCTGASDCLVPTHVHGCFADTGNCDNPTDHGYDRCHAGRDGECTWSGCPQLRDGEPKASGRRCPNDTKDETL